MFTSYSAFSVIQRHFLKKFDVISGSGRRVITSVAMAEGFCSRVAVDNDNSLELSSVLDSASEISEYDSVSESSLSP